MNNIKKYSSGIACMRRKDDKSPKELLLVQHRVTYAFIDLVWGRYKLRKLSKIKFLIKNTTPDEQSELIFKNFEMLWWRATRYKISDCPELYADKLAKFNLAFNNLYDLSKLISQSSSRLPYWEIPKGKHSSKRETDLNCAVRELEEETGIPINMYQIVFNPITYSYQENNITYIIKYYPAKAYYAPQVGKLLPNKKNQLCEIIDIKWMTLPMIRLLGDKRLINIATCLLNKGRDCVPSP
jgi:8-oxo-dGTP pyrophosphatase MutT (NUDIX family)